MSKWRRLQWVNRHWATAWRLLRSGEIAGLIRLTLAFLGRLRRRRTRVTYVDWRRRWVEINDADRTRIDKLVAALPQLPSFTVLLHVDGADAALVTATMHSLTTQVYPDWTLWLTFEEPLDSAISEAMTSIDDGRVRCVNVVPTPSGEWVARLSAGDLLYETALFAVADSICRNKGVAVVYTDHDHLGPNGRFVDPHMKPHWNPDLLSGMDYFGIFTTYQRDIWEAHSTVAKSAHDLALRVTAGLDTSQVVHVPHVLASMRISGGGSHLVPPTVRVANSLPDPPPRVSVLIPTRDQGRMLQRCLVSLRERTDYPDIEVVVVDHETTEAKACKVINDLSGDVNTQVINFSGPFNFAAMINRAAKAATGGVLVLLNNDTEVVDRGWLTEVVAEVSRPEVGIAGAMLLFRDGTVQHAGVHPGVGGLMGHGHKHLPGDDPGYFGRLLVAHGVAAVTGACLAVETTTWEYLGGLDEELLAVAYNDVDLCMKARQAGLRVLFTPHARLVHHESVSRGVDDDPIRNQRLAKELAVMRDRWGDLLDVDPAYSPNLSLDGGGFLLADIPRVQPNWRK